MHDSEQIYFDRHQRAMQTYSTSRPSALSNMQQQYIYNPNHESMFSAVTSAAAPSVSNLSAPAFSMQQHINPSHTLHGGYNTTHSSAMNVARQENMFSFGADSDNEDDEGDTFRDGSIMMQTEYSPMEDSAFVMQNSMAWDPTMGGQINHMAARYPKVHLGSR